MNTLASGFLVLALLIVQGEIYAGVSNEGLLWVSVPVTTQQDIVAGRAGGEGFQMVDSIVFAPSNPDILYMSTNTSQVWKSEDAGLTWFSARKGIKSNGVASLAVHPANPDILFAASSYGASNQQAKKYPNRMEGVHRSIDGGKTWDYVRRTFFNRNSCKGRLVALVKLVSEDGDKYRLFVGSLGEGLLSSLDLGKTWTVIDANMRSITDLAPSQEEPGVLYIASRHGLYRYNGSEISRLGKGLPARPLAIANSSDGSGRMWVAVEGHGVFRSLDRGKTFIPSGARGAVTLKSSPANSNLLFAKREISRLRMPLVSRDGGVTWDQSKQVEILDPIFDRSSEQFWFSAPFAPHPKKSDIVFTASNGKGRILKSIDSGRTWSYSGSGFTGGRMLDIAFLHDDRAMFAFQDHGVWLSKSGDAGPYEFLPVPRVHKLRSCSAVAVSGRHVVAAVGFRKKALVVSGDLGKTWKVQKNTESVHRFIAFDPLNSRYVYAGAFLSRDKGQSWRKIAHEIRAIDDRGWLYSISEHRGKAYVLVSKDRAETWMRLAGELPVKAKGVYDIAVSIKPTLRVYLATVRGVIVVDEGGWGRKDAKSNLIKDDYGMLYVSDVAVDPNNPDLVYAGRRSPGWGQSNGIFMSRDRGETWQNITSNLGPNLTVFSIKINPLTSAVYIGTSLGTFRLESPIRNP